MITLKEIKHLENLSKLEFTEAERENFLAEFDGIVAFASQINTAKVENKSFIKAVDMKNLREDKAMPGLTQAEVVSNAPSKSKGCFSVPRIME